MKCSYFLLSLIIELSYMLMDEMPSLQLRITISIWIHFVQILLNDTGNVHFCTLFVCEPRTLFSQKYQIKQQTDKTEQNSLLSERMKHTILKLKLKQEDKMIDASTITARSAK